MAQDYYETLGVSRSASPDEIKKAYRKMAMKYHPDKNPDDQAAEAKFKEAAQAYEILGDQEKRSRYDQFGHAAFNGGGAGAAGFTDVNDIFESFSDIFGDFFGGGRQRGRSRHQARRGADLRYVCEVQLEQVINGSEKDIEFEVEENCEPCAGSGAEKGAQPEVCSSCGGSGQVVRQQGFFSLATTCPSCRGEGLTIKNPCGSCRGTGRREAKRKIRVTIPPGVDNGTRLRVSGEGEGGYRGGPTGDLYVEIRVNDHERFQRRGNDLFGEVKVSYLQAILGADVEVPLIAEKSRKKASADLVVPRGTQPGDRLRLEGLGVPDIRGRGRGDLYLSVVVDIPRKLKRGEEKLLREVAEARGEGVSAKKAGFFS